MGLMDPERDARIKLHSRSRCGDKHIQVETFGPATTLTICPTAAGVLSQGWNDTSLTIKTSAASQKNNLEHIIILIYEH